jgi:hypothetical protein
MAAEEKFTKLYKEAKEIAETHKSLVNSISELFLYNSNTLTDLLKNRLDITLTGQSESETEEQKQEQNQEQDQEQEQEESEEETEIMAVFNYDTATRLPELTKTGAEESRDFLNAK